jgi:hypothetical protein
MPHATHVRRRTNAAYLELAYSSTGADARAVYHLVMSRMFADDQDTIHIFGMLSAEDMRRLRPLVSGAFQLRDKPLTTLTLAFNEAATIADDDAVVATREALGDALAVCAEQNAALRIVAPPALRRLSTAG